MILEVVDKYVDKVCCWWINSSIYLIAFSKTHRKKLNLSTDFACEIMKHLDDQDDLILKIVQQLDARMSDDIN